ncbi:MAG: hypothetical protein ABIP80_04080 [Ferruginibacter sp.]
MIEILVLIFLTRDIGRLAVQKGLNKNRWKLYTVMGWVGLELLGILIGLLIFGPDNLFSVGLVALGFAFTSYVIVKASLTKRPDSSFDDEIDHFGENV